MRTLIRNARLVSPDREIENGALLLDHGRIAAVLAPGAPLPAADRMIDAGGRFALPGFIDLHSHGADGRDASDATPEAIRHIARKKLAEGVTSWLPTTLTLPPDRLEAIARACAAYRENADACRVPGLHLEGPFLHPEQTGAQNPAHVRPPDPAELERLHALAPVRLLSLAPELPGALDLIARARALGIVCSAAHTRASARDLFAAKTAGLAHLTHFGNAMTPLHHREIGAVGAGLLDDDLMLELICDTHHLSPDMLRLVFKLVPPERLLLVTDSMAGAWLGDGECQLGGLDVELRGGIARLKSNGALAGSTLRFHDGLRHAFAHAGLPLHQLVKATSWNQARSLGLKDLGKLEPGFHADLVLLDDTFTVWKTYVAGEPRFEA